MQEIEERKRRRNGGEPTGSYRRKPVTLQPVLRSYRRKVAAARAQRHKKRIHVWKAAGGEHLLLTLAKN